MTSLKCRRSCVLYNRGGFTVYGYQMWKKIKMTFYIFELIVIYVREHTVHLCQCCLTMHFKERQNIMFTENYNIQIIKPAFSTAPPEV